MALFVFAAFVGTNFAQNAILVSDATPFVESFENSPFDTWQQDTIVGATYWTVDTSNAIDGTQSLRFGANRNGNTTILVSPVLDLTGLTSAAALKYCHLQSVSIPIIGTPAELHVYYRANASDDWTLLASHTTTTSSFQADSVILPNPSATYQVAFKAVDKTLASGLFLDAVQIAAFVEDTTLPAAPCDPITITMTEPYTDDFSADSAVANVSTAGVMPSCWSSLFTGTSAGYAPKVFNGAAAPNANDNALAITSGAGTVLFIFPVNAGTDNFVVLPEFTNSLDELQLLFTAKMSTDTAGTLTLGYMTNTNDASSFTAFVDVPSATSAVACTYNLNGYALAANNHARLALRWSDASTTATSTCYIDDVVVRIARDCAEPTGVTVSNIGPNSASVAWTSGESGQGQWEISYNDTSIIAVANPCYINDLTSSTEYVVSVRAICGAGDTSYWAAAPVTFTTACDPVVVTDETPFEESFNTGEYECWMTDVVSGSDDWIFSYAAHSGAYGVEYSNSIFGDLMDGGEPSILDILSMFGGMMNFGQGSARLVSPVMDLTALTGTPKLTFYRKQHSLMIPLTFYVFYRTSPNSNWIPLANYATAANDWTRESIDLPNPTSTYQISFMSLVDMENMEAMLSGMDPNAMADMESIINLDDVRVGLSGDCEQPQNLAISYLQTNSATVTWDAGNASRWNVEYGPAGFAHGEGTMVVANNNTYTITNLDEGTAYDVYVQGDCGGENISDWNSTTFTTQTTGIADVAAASLRIFPNPANNVLYVRCDADAQQIRICDMMGKVLREETFRSETEISLTSLASGIYMLQVCDGNSVLTSQKFVKE